MGKNPLLTLWEFIGSSFEQTWIPFIQGCFPSAEFGWNWPSGSGEEEFFYFVNAFIFSLFRNYLPLEKGGALYLNNLESPSPKDALCLVWLKLAQRFWRRRFFNIINVFLLFQSLKEIEVNRQEVTFFSQPLENYSSMNKIS